MRYDDAVVMQRGGAGGISFFARPHLSVEQVVANTLVRYGPAPVMNNSVPTAEVGPLTGVPAEQLRGLLVNPSIPPEQIAQLLDARLQWLENQRVEEQAEIIRMAM